MSKSRVAPKPRTANVPPAVPPDLEALLIAVENTAGRACSVTSAAIRFVGGGLLSLDDDDVRATLGAALEQVNGELTEVAGLALKARVGGAA